MKVVVVVGQTNHIDEDKLRFAKAAGYVISRLKGELGIASEQIEEFFGDAKRISDQLERFFLDNKSEDVCLFYRGHGNENGWGVSGYDSDSELESVSYEETLRLLFAGHEGKLIFVNGCCYALAAEAALLSRFSDYLLIGTTPKDEEGDAYYQIAYLLDRWRDGKPFRWKHPRLLLEGYEQINLWLGNEELNALMYPKKTRVL